MVRYLKFRTGSNLHHQDPYYFFQYDSDHLPMDTKSGHDITPENVSKFMTSLVPSFLSLDIDGRVIRVDS